VTVIRAAKIDRTQPEIVEVLRAHGASVQSLATVGSGCPDLLIGYRQRTHVIEVKDGALSPSRRRLTADQVAWWRAWCGSPVILLGSGAEAEVWLREEVTRWDISTS
jgi:Holliday junction resolvase